MSKHFFILLLITQQTTAQHLIPVAKGWAKNSINTVVFRKNSLTTYKNTQYIAFYDSLGHLILGRHKHDENTWQLKQTQYTGDTRDAHRSISIIVDGDGYLHCSFDQHGTRLRYARSKTPGSLELGPEMPMTNTNETRVTYPEFYRLPNGSLLFLYRDGESGIYLVYRDEEQGNKITLAANNNFPTGPWTIENLGDNNYYNWEPTYDQQHWITRRQLNIFIQRVGQGDGETLEDLPPQPISVLEIKSLP
jgi:hypothetical protein